MSITTRHTPLPLQLLGAALLTTLTFAAGPAVGALAGGPAFVPLPSPEPVAVDTPAVIPAPAVPEAAPRATLAASLPVPVRDEVTEAPALHPAELPALAAQVVAPSAPRGPTLVATAPRASALAASAAPASRPSKKHRRCDPEPNPAIRASGDGGFAVERDLVQSYARSLKKLNSLGWSTPHEGDDGRNDGMLIGGIGCGSDLHLAGLRSGDVVHAVNGREVRNYAQALLVYQKVKGDDRIEVQLTRRGKPHTLTYRLVG